MASLFVISLSGCTGPGFAPEEYVEGLRVLGARAEPAAVGAGEKTRVEALIVDTKGRTITADWKFCRVDRSADPSATIASSCVTSESGPDLVPAGTGASLEITMPTDLNFSRLGVPDFTFGVYLPLVLRARVDGADPVTAVYRLRYQPPINPFALLPPNLVPEECRGMQPPNRNPTIARVDRRRGEGAAVTVADGEVIEVTPGEQIRLLAKLGDGSAEPYCVVRGTSTASKIEPTVELSNFAWFTSAGAISPGTTGDEKETTLTVPQDATPGAFNVWVVVRDERGGSNWRRLDLLVK